jgi:hypothetical protein
MATAPDCDQLDVQKVVEVLTKDAHLINHKSRLWRILNISPADVKAAEDQCSFGIITIEDLLTKMMSAWKSKTNGTPKHLCDILNANEFTLSADELTIITFHIPRCTILEYSFPSSI